MAIRIRAPDLLCGDPRGVHMLLVLVTTQLSDLVITSSFSDATANSQASPGGRGDRSSGGSSYEGWAATLGRDSRIESVSRTESRCSSVSFGQPEGSTWFRFKFSTEPEDSRLARSASAHSSHSSRKAFNRVRKMF